MLGEEAAVRAVEEQLERDYQQWRAVSTDAVRMAVVRVQEHELVWIVSWQSEEFVRTRKSKYALIGNGPYLVDRVDGGLHQIGVVSVKTGEGGEEVAVGAELRVGFVLHQQALPVPGDGLVWRNLRFGRPERCDHTHDSPFSMRPARTWAMLPTPASRTMRPSEHQ
ncbi:YrhB domain-containing protein [Streptomyces roseolilacinus]|uniref:YrhB domain-containing protein n=1 Tax=Streptomyces roseolilacinus TaxID=66904 RepID=UPI0038179013